MKCQSRRSSLFMSNVAFVRCSGVSVSRNLFAAAAISSPATCAWPMVVKAKATSRMRTVGFMGSTQRECRIKANRKCGRGESRSKSLSTVATAMECTPADGFSKKAFPIRMERVDSVVPFMKRPGFLSVPAFVSKVLALTCKQCSLCPLGVVVVAVMSATAQMAHPQGLVINEFLAVNDTGLTDSDGVAADWIEIYNPGATTVSLLGWSLTDDPAQLRKWQFPATNLAANAYLLVFASGKNRTNAAADLHTNFQLEGDGEYLALMMPDGVTVASQFNPKFPRQRKDISFGLGADAGLH